MTDTGAEGDLAVYTAPIPGDSPTGVSLRYENAYQHIAEARREEDANLPQGDWVRPLKRANWNQVEQLCREALAKKTKDIQIAGWLTEAWLQQEGLDGFARGLALVESLCREYWDGIYPRAEDGEIEYRVAPFAWINDNLSHALRVTVPIAESASDLGETRLTLADWDDALRLENLGRKDAGAAKTAEQGGKVTRAAFMTSVSLTPAAYFGNLLRQAERCTQRMFALERLMQEKLGDDTPGLGRVRDVLEAIGKAVREFGGELAPAVTSIEGKREAGRKAEADVPPAQAGTGGKDMVENRSMQEQIQPNTGLIRSREEAYRRLAEAADYLLRTEPHSPTPYLVMRAVAWGNLPLTGLLQELVQNEGDLQQLYKLLGMNPGS